jgi:hypothetical protein
MAYSGREHFFMIFETNGVQKACSKLIPKIVVWSFLPSQSKKTVDQFCICTDFKSKEWLEGNLTKN